MYLTNFEYNGKKTSIQVNPNDKMQNICKKFAEKLSIDLNSVYFLYSGNPVNFELSFSQIANNEDKIKKEINVLVYSKNNNNNNNESKKVISKDIICPKCYESCIIDLNNYKICLYDCKKNHKTNISLDGYENTQDISKIICDKCKNSSISTSFNHSFYKCFDCMMNICPLCKTKHDKEHYIIKYEEANFKCDKHKEHYYSYCIDCKQNLCILCENTHKGHKIVYYGQIMPDKNDIKTKLEELKQTIDIFENNIKDIVKILNKVVQNIELYYKIKNNIFQNLDNENRNFESLCNLINITKDDYAIRDMNEIINEKNACNKFNNIFKLYQKINAQNNDDLNINEYSYECLNAQNLNCYLYEGTKEGKIEILLENNGNNTWPINNTKLISDEISDLKVDEIILKPQKPKERSRYDIFCKGLISYPPGEYKSKLKFCVNGNKIGEILTIKIIIKSKNEIKDKEKKYVMEFREVYGLSLDEYSDEVLLEKLKKSNYDYASAFLLLLD